MKELYTEIGINASAKMVWDVLADFDNFGKWNSFIKEISGIPERGSHIQLFIKPPNSNGLKIKPKIQVYDPEKEISWLGNLWIPKLIDGRHSLIIKELDDSNILFIQKERFTGILVPFFSSMLENTKSGFEIMNRELKMEAEKRMK